MSKAEELATKLDEHAEDHFEVAQSCDMRPVDTLNWQHFVTSKEAAAHLRALEENRQMLVEALESLINDPGDDHIRSSVWDRARTALEQAKELT